MLSTIQSPKSQQAVLIEQGFAILPQWFSAEKVAFLKANARDLFNNSDNGVDVYMLGNCPPWLQEACSEPRLGQCLDALGVTDPEFLSVKTVIKDAKRQFPSPWHQDRPYWGGAEKYSLWVALDDCTIENGCLRIVPGSHAAGESKHEDIGNQSFTMRLAAGSVDESKTMDVLLKAGDALLFHDCLVHASHPNLSGIDRWSLIATYRSRSLNDTSTRWSRSLPMYRL